MIGLGIIRLLFVKDYLILYSHVLPVLAGMSWL